MEIVLIAFLYFNTVSKPIAYMSGYVYSNMSECWADAEEVKQRLMETAPNKDSYVNVQCIVMPKEV